MNLTTAEAQHIRKRAKQEGLTHLPSESVLLGWLREYREKTRLNSQPQGERHDFCLRCKLPTPPPEVKEPDVAHKDASGRFED